MKFIEIKGYNNDIRINPKFIYATSKPLGGEGNWYYELTTITGRTYYIEDFNSKEECLKHRDNLEYELLKEEVWKE